MRARLLWARLRAWVTGVPRAPVTIGREGWRAQLVNRAGASPIRWSMLPDLGRLLVVVDLDAGRRRRARHVRLFGPGGEVLEAHVCGFATPVEVPPPMRVVAGEPVDVRSMPRDLAVAILGEPLVAAVEEAAAKPPGNYTYRIVRVDGVERPAPEVSVVNETDATCYVSIHRPGAPVVDPGGGDAGGDA